MDSWEARELIESTHSFPCNYIFKVVGYHRNQFTDRVLDATREVVGGAMTIKHSTRETRSGKHISVTIEPYLDESDQVLAIYEKIRELDDVIMYW